jgi:hypothetical protein
VCRPRGLARAAHLDLLSRLVDVDLAVSTDHEKKSGMLHTRRVGSGKMDSSATTRRMALSGGPASWSPNSGRPVTYGVSYSYFSFGVFDAVGAVGGAGGVSEFQMSRMMSHFPSFLV